MPDEETPDPDTTPSEMTNIPAERQDMSIEEVYTTTLEPDSESSRVTPSDRGAGIDPWSHGGREPGSGSLSEQEIENDLDPRHGYEMDSATGVGIPKDDNYDADLQALNEGRHGSDGGHSARETERDKLRVTEALCSRLDLNPVEQEEALGVMECLDLNEFGAVGAIETVALGVIKVRVDIMRVNRDEEAEWVSHSDTFREVRDHLNISMSDLNTVSARLNDILGGNPSRPMFAPTAGQRGPDPNLPGPTPISEQPSEYWDHVLQYYEDKSEEYWDEAPTELIENIPERHRDILPEKYQ